MDRAEKLRILKWIMGIGMLVALAYHGAFCEIGAPYPFQTFLFRPDDRFNDFLNGQKMHFDPYGKIEILGSCFPFLGLIICLATCFKPKIGLILFEGLFAFGYIRYLWTAIRGSTLANTLLNVAIFTGCSYPFLFEADRGNFECLIFFYTAGFVWLYSQKRYNGAAFLLGCALATKPFGLVFLPLFVFDRQFKALALSILVALGLTVISLAVFKGTVAGNYHNWLAIMKLYDAKYAVDFSGLGRGHSLWGLVKCVFFPPAYRANPGDVLFLKKCYFIAVGIMYGLVLLAIYTLRFQYWEKIGILICCMITFPFVSGDYTLLSLCIPLVYFLKSEDRDPLDMTVTVLLGLLFIPKQYYAIPFTQDATTSIFTTPLLLMALGGTLLSRANARTAREIVARQRDPDGELSPAIPKLAPAQSVHPQPQSLVKRGRRRRH